MRFADPAWLSLFLLIPVPWLIARARPRIAWPSLSEFETIRPTWASRLRGLPVLLRTLVIVLLSGALARPQTVGGTTRIAGQGVAIVVALDHSSSMNAADFPSDHRMVPRLEAARHTFAKFIAGRTDDPIGLVVFANYPDRKSAPTLDHSFLLETVHALRSARAGDDGTNIGDAIALALGDLKQAQPKKKVLVLLTDGRNEPAVPQPLDPEAAATTFFERGRTLLIEEGWTGICRLVGEEYERQDTSRAREVLEPMTRYFVAHLKRLDYRECLASGAAIGSGVVEGAAKTLGLRLKARGARWRHKNARHGGAGVCTQW